VSIVIPAYNEEHRLRPTLEAWLRFLGTQTYSFEVIIVDDGSRDRTPDVIAEICDTSSSVRAVMLPENRGKGAAVKSGILSSLGSYVFYVDSDLSVDPKYLPAALAELESGYGAVIGSRSLGQYIGSKPHLSRILQGAIVQVVRRAVTFLNMRDTQCGFKGFSRRVAMEVFSRTVITSFAFDVEVLFIAHRMGETIKELPVVDIPRPGSKLIVRKHLLPFVRDIVRVRLNDLKGYYA
jgi:dolichyl-phosphate beta-glucosyltransferase